MVTQLSNFNFSVFFKETTTLDVDCLNTNITARSYSLSGHHIITLPLGCRAQTGLLDFSPEGSILSNAPEHYILRTMDFNITHWLDIDEDDFSTVVSDIFNLPIEEIHFDDIRHMLGNIDYIWGVDRHLVAFIIGIIGSAMSTLVLILFIYCYFCVRKYRPIQQQPVIQQAPATTTSPGIELQQPPRTGSPAPPQA
jgi:hypothetical protein